MNDDAVLLRRYAEEKSEAAFTELVRRHVDLVYSAALRRTDGDAHGAADVVQHVFTRLARDARKLAGHAVLTAWLYTATRNAAIDLKRAERRRETREQEAQRMHELQAESVSDHDWAKLRPVLDAAMDELTEADRAAVLWRFFEKRGFAEIGAMLNVGEDAARMRTGRALEKLRERLAHRGITSTTAALAVALGAQAVSAAPAGFVVQVATSAIVGAGVAAGASVGMANFAASISAVAAAVALTAAWWEGKELRTTTAVLETTRQEARALLAQTKELAMQTEAEVQRTAAIRRAAAAPRTPSGPGGEAPVRDLTEETRKFIAAHAQEVKALVAAQQRNNFEQNWGWRLRAIGLSPAECERLTALALSGVEWEFRLTEGGWSTGPLNRDDPRPQVDAITARLRAALDEKQREAYDNMFWLSSARELARTVAVASYDSPEPLTSAQAQGIVDALGRHGLLSLPIPGRGGAGTPVPGLGLDRIDWVAATRDLAAILSPRQLAAFEAAKASLTAQNQQAVRSNQLLAPSR